MGRPKTPLKTLKLRGSRHVRQQEIEPWDTAEFREPLEALGEMASALWNQFYDDLCDLGLLTPDTIVGFRVLCSAWQDYWEAVWLLDEEGLTVKDDRGRPKRHPAVMIREKALALFTKLAARFGIVPA